MSTGMLRRLTNRRFIIIIIIIIIKQYSIRRAWQSQTWDRPVPQVRVESQFSYSKYLSQQRHLEMIPKTVS